MGIYTWFLRDDIGPSIAMTLHDYKPFRSGMEMAGYEVGIIFKVPIVP
jgi:hypothetical protein